MSVGNVNVFLSTAVRIKHSEMGQALTYLMTTDKQDWLLKEIRSTCNICAPVCFLFILSECLEYTSLLFSLALFSHFIVQTYSRCSDTLAVPRILYIKSIC